MKHLLIFMFAICCGLSSLPASAVDLSQKIPSYAKESNVEQKIEKQGEKINNLGLAIVLVIIFVAMLVGIGFLATGINAQLGIKILVSDGIAVVLLVIGYSVVNHMLAA